MKALKSTLSVLLALCLVLALAPATASATEQEPELTRGIQNSIIIDTDASGGYEGDYVVIYNPATSSSTSYSTGTMTGLIETTIEPNILPNPSGSKAQDAELPFYKIDVDSKLKKLAETMEPEAEPEPTRASYSVGETKTFRILQQYSPTGSSSVSFECLYVGQHCYIWTPVSSSNNTYPLDEIDSTYAKLAADEFDSKFDLMQSSFGNHTNGSSGDGKLHMLYYNINDGWQPGQGYVAGFFYQVDISNNGLPILNIDTYPGVYYKNSAGTEYKRMDDTYNTMVHEYQHLINYSNTSSMSTWLNECFSAAAEEICYPGSSVVGRIQSWEEYYYSDNNDWLNPPKEFMYDSANSLHTGFSMYNWDNNLDNNAILALYSQVSFFAQYLFTRFGNTIYKQISNKYSSSATSAIASATGVNCADLVRDFRVAVTANAAQDQYNGIYGFKVQNGYDPENYNNVQNPYNLLSPVIFTGSSCSIKGGGAITVKPVNGVYNPPSGASSSLKYIGIKLASPYIVTAVSNNDSYGTVSVNNTTITASPATGYYVESADVIEGTATVSVSGNTISVAPSSDCTVRVNFAPKPSYTVNFVASGNAEGSQTAYLNDAITLPSSVSVNPDGWTFMGWVDAQLAETTDAPAFYAPGASYTVTGNTTLYALYNRVEEIGGDVVYQRTSDLAVGGKYAITIGNYAVQNTVYNTNNNHYINSQSVKISDDENTLTVASSVNINSILYEIESGSATAGWVFKNVANGKYMCLTSDEYLTVGSTPVAWLYQNGDLNNQIDSEGYYYLSRSSNSSYFTTSKGAQGTVVLYQEISPVITYYTTDPAVSTYAVEIVSDSATFQYDGTLRTQQQYTVTVNGEAVEANGLTFTLPTGDTLTITPSDKAAVTHVKEGTVENTFEYAISGNEDQYTVTAVYGTLTVTPRPVEIGIIGNHDTVVYDGTRHDVKDYSIACEDEVFMSAFPDTIWVHIPWDPSQKSWIALGTDPGTYYMGMTQEAIARGYLGQKDTSENAPHFTDDFDPTLTLIEDGYLEIIAGPEFKSQSLLLEGKIGVRFYVCLPEIEGYEYTGVDFTITGKDGDDCAATVPFSSELPTNSSGYYGFTYYVGVIQMADTITATLNYTVDGEAQTLEKTYSVKEYFEAFDANYEAHPELYTDANVVELIKATADLGHYVQAYLDASRSEWSVPTDHAAMDKVYEDNILDYRDAAVAAVADHALAAEGSNTDIKSLGYALIMDSDTTIRVTIVPKSGFTGTITATVDGEAVEVKKISNVKYAVDIPNVQAHELSKQHTIAITTENGTVTLTGSGLSFVKILLDAYTTDDTVQKAAVAIWRYSQFADIVKGNTPEANKK